jgi:hypothetical protein
VGIYGFFSRCAERRTRAGRSQSAARVFRDLIFYFGRVRERKKQCMSACRSGPSHPGVDACACMGLDRRNKVKYICFSRANTTCGLLMCWTTLFFFVSNLQQLRVFVHYGSTTSLKPVFPPRSPAIRGILLLRRPLRWREGGETTDPGLYIYYSVGKVFGVAALRLQRRCSSEPLRQALHFPVLGGLRIRLAPRAPSGFM